MTVEEVMIADAVAAAAFEIFGPERPFWITRDRSTDGELDEMFDLWRVRPVRSCKGLGTIWYVDDFDTEHVMCATAATIAGWLAASVTSLPATDAECVRVG